MEEELKKKYDDAVIELIPSTGGVFEIVVDGRTIFSKKELKRFPTEDEIVRLIKQ